MWSCLEIILAKKKKRETALLGTSSSSCRAGSRNTQRGMETIPMRWSGRVVPTKRRKSVTSIFCDPTCAKKQAKTHGRVGITMSVNPKDDWRFQLPLLITVALRRLSVLAQGTDPVAQAAISTTYLPPERITLFITSRYFPVPTVPATVFFFKGTLKLMSWTAPLPWVSHLERQSEQQGQKALQKEHSREAKQIKDIFCAFKASPINSAGFWLSLPEKFT